MNKLLTPFLILNLNGQISANHAVEEAHENPHTDLSHSISTKTNFTLSEYQGQ